MVLDSGTQGHHFFTVSRLTVPWSFDFLANAVKLALGHCLYGHPASLDVNDHMILTRYGHDIAFRHYYAKYAFPRKWLKTTLLAFFMSWCTVCLSWNDGRKFSGVTVILWPSCAGAPVVLLTKMSRTFFAKKWLFSTKDPFLTNFSQRAAHFGFSWGQLTEICEKNIFLETFS